MKKILIFILGLVFTVQAFGQSGIYSERKYLDKFDDVVKSQNIKTLIEKTDSTFVIETKGSKPVTYHILNILPAGCRGDKDNIVNLVANVYGYQTCWCVVRDDMINEYKNLHDELFQKALQPTGEGLDANEFSKLEDYYLFIIHRVVTTQYSHTYESEYLWVEDEFNTKLGKDINRIIYKK